VKKICVVTGTRAEYGLLRWVMEGVKSAAGLELQLVVTGAHLSSEFGMTYHEIESDGFEITRKVEMLVSSDSSVGVAKSMGLGMIGFADVFGELKPDLVLVLGDRYEIFSAASAALVARIPLAHLHGGESTEGAFDEAIRHSITKMSQLHFVAAEEYRQRVIQLGEDPNRVFLVGGLGIDNILKLKLLGREALEASLDFQFGKKNLLITFHPVTLEENLAQEQMAELLSSLAACNDTNFIFTMPNADSEGRALFKMIESFVARHSNAVAYPSLGQLRYLSTIAQVDGVIGNSSSGLIEVPSFKKTTINIGDRQTGRLKAASVIDCDPIKSSIDAALFKLYSKDFQKTLDDVSNPYGQGGASDKIVSILKKQEVKLLVKKHFYNIPNQCLSGDI
jgi:GDP/UDP-N,N'-diacetylbacillosamine 2-epimerase (hydrolysing)